MDLKTFFKENPRFAIAFSGGVDSAYLLYAASEAGCDVKAYYVNTNFQPQFELDDAKKFAYLTQAPMMIEKLDVMSCPKIVGNGADRCYHCKRAIYTRLWELVRADGFDMLCDGTNATDDASVRAGMSALSELGVRSPLRECGLPKSAVRRLSCEAGLFTHDKPSYACLATRIPTGTEITEELLQKVEQSEHALHGLGFSDFRIRYLDGSAKIQIPESQFKMIVDKRKKIIDAVSPYFEHVLVDLMPRKTEV
ncbi:uncharacterized protein SAMN02745823_01567 [Sporobacter termitidis DSM 10068]|uniref:Asparagine synthetase domain-containing protein n=1 Tax=Sporobacter termitidis DSM 10068 TaxID=1123282 RepID=A0A1M5X448_9FIRM|nr:ATP-dependent sacrificial sulfur transferase LarE [Sporobacter termitidis]SHH94294.1 uncharacterized protein SAMN02745823_01567 [Sporobacter termitidis DSM 10068]